MPVYMIQAGDEWGPVKIGHGDPVARLNDCQVGNHLRLRLIRIFEGGVAEEYALHERFTDLWIRGEWHNFSSAMLRDVGLVETFPEPPTPIDPATIEVPHTPPAWAEFGSKIRALRKSLGLTQEKVSAEIGISRNGLAMIELGHDLPGRATLLRMVTYYGLPLDFGRSASP